MSCTILITQGLYIYSGSYLLHREHDAAVLHNLFIFMKLSGERGDG